MTRTVFIHANVLDGEHPAKPDCTVVVEGGRVTSVAVGAATIEPGDRVIDCTARTLMPGMVQGHFHSTYLDERMTMMPPIGFARPPAYQAYAAANALNKMLRCGWTSVVAANTSFDVDASLAAAVADGLVVGARIVPGGRELITTADSNDVVPWWWESQMNPYARICDGPDEFARAARAEIKRGAEIIKLYATGGHAVRLSSDYSSITRAEMRAAVDAAHALGKRVRAHVASKAGIIACIEAGVDILDHGDGLDDECIAAIVEKGIIWLPSVHVLLRLMEAVDGVDTEALARRGYVIPETGFQSDWAKQFRATCDVIPAAVEAGVKICLGDDYGAGIMPHGSNGREPAVYVDAGIPALEVLKWATVNGGELVGLEGLGRLEEGAIADIVVVNGDPSVDIHLLADVENILGVMRDGELYFDDKLTYVDTRGATS